MAEGKDNKGRRRWHMQVVIYFLGRDKGDVLIRRTRRREKDDFCKLSLFWKRGQCQ